MQKTNTNYDSSRLDRTASRPRVGGGDKKPRIDTRAHPKKCLSGPSHRRLNRGGDTNCSTWWPACPGSVWKWLWVKRSPLNGPKAPDRHPDEQTDSHSWFHSKCTLKRSKGPVDMKSMIFKGRTDRQTDTPKTIQHPLLRAVISKN